MENNNSQKEVEEILNSFTEEIDNLSDEEVLNLYKETNMNTEKGIKNIRETAFATIDSLRRKELQDARKAYENTVQTRKFSKGTQIPQNVNAQRKLLESIWDNPEIPHALTMSFRDKKDLSDNDVKTILEDLEELGFLEES